jgi:hypothetical protein
VRQGHGLTFETGGACTIGAAGKNIPSVGSELINGKEYPPPTIHPWPDVMTRLWSSESGRPADPLTIGQSSGLTDCRGWRSNRYPRLILQVILRMHPHRMSLSTYIILMSVTKGADQGMAVT